MSLVAVVVASLLAIMARDVDRLKKSVSSDDPPDFFKGVRRREICRILCKNRIVFYLSLSVFIHFRSFSTELISLKGILKTSMEVQNRKPGPWLVFQQGKRE
ncbi:hypothetical protein MRB53_024601 [Persea americana]|uniref:Uncharacterized protein n=1 Tax=Persea americana TaxID=3435 RepID=A0ACC2LDN6_PERAE|nr:hypothetical protein MRB53_024601 [Persea americana]